MVNQFKGNNNKQLNCVNFIFSLRIVTLFHRSFYQKINIQEYKDWKV